MSIEIEALDQQIAAAEAAANDLRRAKAQAQAAAEQAMKQSEIYQRQQAYLQAEEARRQAIREAFVSGALQSIQDRARMQEQKEQQFQADVVKLEDLSAQVRELRARLTVDQAMHFSARDAIMRALMAGILAHDWQDYWLSVNPAKPDEGAVKTFEQWCNDLWDTDLTSPDLPSDPRTTAGIARFQAGTLAFQVEGRRQSHEWSDSTPKAEQMARQRAATMRGLGLIP